MMTRPARILLGAAALAAAASPARAQFFDQTTIRLGPQVVQYRLKAPVDETVTELAVPLFAVMPISDRFSLDIGTAYAQSTVKFDGGESTVSGLTDTQLRANYTIGTDFVILTLGANLPTGRSTVEQNELLAASRIGNDFLSFPISNLGTGSAITGGLAVARPFGAWNFGVGGSVRVASAFEPVRVDSGPLPRYQPGNEYKVRVGLDRLVGAGQLAFGFTFSTFGQDDFGGSLYNTGDRFVGQVGYSSPTPFGSLSLGAWNLYRGEGQIVGGQSVPWDNIANVSLGLGFMLPNGGTLEPNVQVRSWMQRVAATDDDPARTDQSLLGEVGLRARFAVGGLTLFPGGGFTVGRLAAGAGQDADLAGFRASLGIQLR